MPWELDAHSHAFIARNPGGATFGQIARALGCTEDAVYDIFRGAMDKLQRANGVEPHSDYGPRIIDDTAEDESVQLSVDERFPLHADAKVWRDVEAILPSPYTADLNQRLDAAERTVYALSSLMRHAEDLGHHEAHEGAVKGWFVVDNNASFEDERFRRRRR